MQSSTNAETDIPCPWLSQIKPWNGQGTLLEHLVNHYALMAMNKGTIDHARHMTRKYQHYFPGLHTLIVQRLKELRNEHRSNES
jgi:hypothetical protein